MIHVMKRCSLTIVIFLILSPSLSAVSPKSVLSINHDSWLFTSAVKSYHDQPAKISTIMTCTTLGLPALLLLEKQQNPWELPLAYAAAMGTAYITKSMIKDLVQARRPMAYITAHGEYDKKAFASFPSGHTMVCFAASSFLATAYAKRYDDSKMFLPAVSLSFSLSTVTGYLRYESGSHYPVDILAGAILGSIIGSSMGYLLY